MLVTGLIFAADVAPLRHSFFLEKMRAPALCDDFVDLGYGASHELESKPLFRPLGELLLRRTEMPLIQSCLVKLAGCKEPGCVAAGNRCLGMAFAMGQGVGKDLNRARLHFERAATLGDAWSARQAVAVTWHMAPAVKAGFYPRLEALAMAGDPIAARMRARLWLVAYYPPDRRQAGYWYDKAARTGDAVAMCDLAALVASGPYGQRDDRAGLAVFERVAETGNADALANVGLFHELGRGTPVDQALANRLHLQAAQAGSASGRRNLAISLERGAGMPADPRQALALFQAAAADGDVFAQQKLGINPFSTKGRDR